MYLYGEQVERQAVHLKGGAGLDGVDGPTLKTWLLRYEVASEHLRAEMAEWATLLSSGSPEYAMYRAANSARMLAVDKQPGVRPLATATIFMRLWGRCNLQDSARHEARDACGNVQSGTGLKAGIEANIHAVRTIFPASAGWFDEDDAVDGEATADDDAAPDTQAFPESPHDGAGMEEELEEVEAEEAQPSYEATSEFDRYEVGVGFGTLLIDAKNAFNELDRYLMLWEVYHRWNTSARFAFNRYRHQTIVYVRRRPGETPYVILSKNGVAQGCTFGSYCFCVGLMPLVEQMHEAVPETLKPAYCDDISATGRAEHNARVLAFLSQRGPDYRYFPEPDKSIYICRQEDEPVARAAFAAHGLADVKFVRGARYLGSTIGSGEHKEVFVKKKVAVWVAAVETFAKLAPKYPQAVYTCYTICLQGEWQYLCRTTPGIAHLLEPLERALRTSLLPAFLAISTSDISHRFREQLHCAVRSGGFGIRNPMQVAEDAYSTSVATCGYLVNSLVDSDEPAFDQDYHLEFVAVATKGARKIRDMNDHTIMERRSRGDPSAKRRWKKALEGTGSFLTARPHPLNGTILSADEWRDSTRLLFGYEPLDMPQHCDGCGERMTVTHALACKKGGLVHVRHDDMARMWRFLGGLAFTPRHTEREPHIESCASRRRVNGQTTDQRPNPPPTTPTPTPTQQPTSQRRQSQATEPQSQSNGKWASMASGSMGATHSSMFVSLTLINGATATRTLRRSC